MKRQGRKKQRKLTETLSWMCRPPSCDDGVTIEPEAVRAEGVEYIDALLNDLERMINDEDSGA